MRQAPVGTTMLDVAKNKTPADEAPKRDRHKPRRLVGVPEPLATALEELATEEFNTLAEQVKIACREYLERRGRLPKPKR